MSKSLILIIIALLYVACEYLARYRYEVVNKSNYDLSIEVGLQFESDTLILDTVPAHSRKRIVEVGGPIIGCSEKPPDEEFHSVTRFLIGIVDSPQTVRDFREREHWIFIPKAHTATYSIEIDESIIKQ